MIGSLLHDRYRIDAELGRGGMGAVFRAHDTVLDRNVAVKLLTESGLGTEGRKRMLREAQAIAKLNHPNIVQVHDAGQLDETPYIVMELVQGQSLHDHPPREFEGIVAVARQICAALEHAHQHGIIHRDLKPENVILGPDGSAKLMDFGLARSVASRLTNEGGIVGTVFYLAPELALGQDFDGRADLYSLGVMLYELTTGELPFSKGDPLTVISQHIHANPVPPRSKNNTIPPLLEQLTLQLLTKNPIERPRSAAAVRQLLEEPSLLDPEAEIEREQSLLARIVRGRFVARSKELKQAKGVWTEASTGQGQTLLISGEPGVGKSRLLRELVTQVEVSGGLALIGEAYKGAVAPYAPFGPILRGALKRAAQERVQISQMNLSDLLVLAPELRPSYPTVASNPSLSPEAEQHRQFESVIALLSAIAEQAPILVAIEDAHWADSGSLALLHYLARRTQHQPILIVIAHREVESDEAGLLQEISLDLDRSRLATRLGLAPFTRKETHDLLHAIFEEEITPEFLDGIYRQTEGNPFFIEEVCKTLVESGKLFFENGLWHRPSMDELEIPQSVRKAIQSRVTALPDSTQEVLRLAAVLGREFEYETLAEASELDEDTLIDALESAQRAQLIEEATGGDGVSFNFVHALIPNTVAEGVQTLRRRRLHRRAADAIQKIRPMNYEAIAYHYAEAGEEALSLGYYVKAGERAAKAYTNPEAERHFLAALELVEEGPLRARLLGELALVQSRQGKFELALERWLEGIKLYGQLGEQEPMASYFARSIRAAGDSGDLSRSLSLAQEGIGTTEGAPDSPGLADLYHEVGRAFVFNGMVGDGKQTLRKALAIAEATAAIPIRAEALITLGLALASASGQPAEARILLEEAAGLARASGLPEQEARALNNLAVIENQFMGDWSRSVGYYIRAGELARSTGSATHELFYLANACGSALERGDLNWARERLPALLKAQQDLAIPSASASNLRVTSGMLARYAGELDTARQIFLDLYEDETKSGSVYRPAIFLAEIALETRKDLGAADAMIQDASRELQMWGPERLLLFEARLHAAEGQSAEARQSLGEFLTKFGGHAIGMSQALYTLARAEVAVVEQDWEEARRAYAQTVEYLDLVGLRWYRARTLWDWAEALIAESGGRATESALKLLEEARAQFDSCGAPIYTDQIQARLKELKGLRG